MYKTFIRPFLFSVDPEKVHHLTFNLLKWQRYIPGAPANIRHAYRTVREDLETEALGLTFKNPVGLAAGFDKDGKLFNELGNFGFSFIEVGTVTPKPQAGNPKPRLFRLKADNGLINRMGFNNDGVDALVERLKKRSKHADVLIGGNIGKNKVTPNSDALQDYLYCFRKLFDYVDYFVVNVSSPNTPNLRELQEKEPLKKLLSALQKENELKEDPKPILLKIAPDLTDSQLDDIVEIVGESKIKGVIATNTTISREGLKTPKAKVEEIGAGGLSGKPVQKRATEVIGYLNRKGKGSFDIIAVGGIFTAADAQEKLDAGASLVQVYTGFIYEGPRIIQRICKGLKPRF